MLILSWNIKKMLNAFEAMIDGDDDALIKWFGYDQWNLLIEEADGNTDEAMEWVKNTCKSKVKATYQLLQAIYRETEDNLIVQKRLKAIGL